MTLFKNSKGSTELGCGCRPAISHWEKHTGKRATICSLKGCTRQATIGGHVIKCHGNASNVQYIVPLCPAHNNSHFVDCFEINAHIIPVLVQDYKGCKK